MSRRPALAAAPAEPPAPAPARPWRAWWPPAPTIDRREALRIAVGATLGLFVAGGLCLWVGWGPVWLVAPLGASAVLVYGVPASPLAQPWSVIGGNTLSALVGITMLHLVPSPLPAAALAVGVAIAAMIALRCLHPPGGAAALLTVMVGAQDWSFALFPVLANSLLLVTVGVAYNRATGRSYPHVAHPPPAPLRRFTEADIDAVLKRHNVLMHTPRDEIETLLEEAEAHALARRLHELRCRDIMSRDPVTVPYTASLPAAWALLREHAVKALPVIDGRRQVVGIVTQADFMRGAHVDVIEGPDGRPHWQIHTDLGPGGERPAAVSQIMSRRVRVASADRSLADVVPIFSETGHHHIPVIGTDGVLVGILTQTDVVRALRHVAEPPAAAA